MRFPLYPTNFSINEKWGWQYQACTGARTLKSKSTTFLKFSPFELVEKYPFNLLFLKNINLLCSIEEKREERSKSESSLITPKKCYTLIECLIMPFKKKKKTEIPCH